MDVGEIKVYEARSTVRISFASRTRADGSSSRKDPSLWLKSIQLMFVRLLGFGRQKGQADPSATMAFSPVDPDILISGCKQNKAEYHRVAVWNIKRESSSNRLYKGGSLMNRPKRTYSFIQNHGRRLTHRLPSVGNTLCSSMPAKWL